MPVSPDSLASLEPDPLEPDPKDVERYVVALQELARRDPKLAQRLAWNQIRLARNRAVRHREEVHDTLARLFRLGGAPEPPLDGPCRGLIVATTTFAGSDPVLHALSAAWAPWVGKRFDRGAERGDNVVRPSFRPLAKLLWPRYALDPLDEDHLAGFPFRTSTGPSSLDPGRDVLRLDYRLPENPGLLVRDILDEVAQVVPGAYLGRALVRGRLAAYFALEPGELVPVAEPERSFGDPLPAPA